MSNDAYGRTVTLSSSGGIDTYTVGGTLVFDFPTGTPLDQVYTSINSVAPTISEMPLAVAQNQQITLFQNALESYLDMAYSLDTRWNLQAIHIVAVEQGLTARAAYIYQLFAWATALIQYASTYVASIQAMSTSADVAASTWDFSSVSMQDPQITIIGALSIND